MRRLNGLGNAFVPNPFNLRNLRLKYPVSSLNNADNYVLIMIGVEWLIEAFGCADARLRDRAQLAVLFENIVNRMDLKPIGEPVWHQFPETGGITGMWLLQESHLTVHTFPEYHSACINVFCCTLRPGLDWRSTLFATLGATDTVIREYQRVYHRRS